MLSRKEMKERAKTFAQNNLKISLNDEQVADYVAIIIAVKPILFFFYLILFFVITAFLWVFCCTILFPNSDLLENEWLTLGGLSAVFILTIYLVFKEKLPFSKVRPVEIYGAKNIEAISFVAVLIGYLHPAVSDLKYVVYPINTVVIYLMLVYIAVYMLLLGEINFAAFGVLFISAVSIYLTMSGFGLF